MLHVACCMAARRLPGEFSSRYIGIALGSVEERAHKPRLSVKPTVTQQLEVINDLLRIAVEPRTDR